MLVEQLCRMSVRNPVLTLVPQHGKRGGFST
jgi:hypothetical protein